SNSHEIDPGPVGHANGTAPAVQGDAAQVDGHVGYGPDAALRLREGAAVYAFAERRAEALTLRRQGIDDDRPIQGDRHGNHESDGGPAGTIRTANRIAELIGGQRRSELIG